MNQINKRKLIIGGILVLAVVALGVGLFLTKNSPWSSLSQEVVAGEPVDVVLDFYGSWLEALQGTSTNPFESGLAEDPILSSELRNRISDSKGVEGGPDPVLCQTNIPVQISARLISELEDSAQVLVVSRDKTQPEQAIVTLKGLNEGWYIDSIECSPGEFAPPREFSFDREGFLLKSVVPPLDSNYWHLVFVENDVPGHVAPLLFSGDSMCTALDESQSVCDPNKFIEPSKAHVQGEMTETGVKVKRVKLLP